MSDETLMVEGNGSIYLAGPYLVKAAIGEDIDNETLGGAVTHTEISGSPIINSRPSRNAWTISKKCFRCWVKNQGPVLTG
jgi:acetyl-CoA carboxylase carboxyltransferase component